jgi:hypothetical protein
MAEERENEARAEREELVERNGYIINVAGDITGFVLWCKPAQGSVTIKAKHQLLGSSGQTMVNRASVFR